MQYEKDTLIIFCWFIMRKRIKDFIKKLNTTSNIEVEKKKISYLLIGMSLFTYFLDFSTYAEVYFGLITVAGCILLASVKKEDS